VCFLSNVLGACPCNFSPINPPGAGLGQFPPCHHFHQGVSPPWLSHPPGVQQWGGVWVCFVADSMWYSTIVCNLCAFILDQAQNCSCGVTLQCYPSVISNVTVQHTHRAGGGGHSVWLQHVVAALKI
jgi:hypothetical protein